MAAAKAGPKGAAADTPPRRSLSQIQENLNNGADRDVEIERAKVVPQEKPETTLVREPSPERTEPEKPKPFVYDEWFKEQPIEARETFARNVVGNYEAHIKQIYSPEVFNLLEEAGTNPALMKKLQRASKDKDLRTFLFETAFQIYGDESAPEAPDAGTPERKPKYVADLEEQVAGLRQERETEKTAAARHTYESQRTAELAALQREFPELKFDPARTDSSEYLRVADIIDRTETASQKAGRVLSYRDTYENMRKAWGATDKTAQRAIPQTTTRTETAPPRQAPMNDKDSRVRMRETINRHGGSLSTLAAALARGK